MGVGAVGDGAQDGDIVVGIGDEILQQQTGSACIRLLGVNSSTYILDRVWSGPMRAQ